MTSWPDNLEDDLGGVLHDLCAVPAPSGHEDRLSALITRHLISRGLDPVTDRLGQVAVSLGTGDGNRVLVTAHLDQLGLVVASIEPTGYLRVQRLGGVPERVLPGMQITVMTRNGDVPAVVGVKSHHLTPPEEKYRGQPVTELYLDVGARNPSEVAQLGIRVGDPCAYGFTWQLLASDRVATTSLDDRFGVAALLALVDRLTADPAIGPVAIAFSTQEEFHVRGTLALAERFNPDIVINVDVSPATDTPDLAGVSPVRLGGGVVLSRLSFHGRGTLGGLIPHPALVTAVESAAATAGVDLQYEAIIGLITDAAFLPMASAEGIAAVGLGIPVRYTHSPVETGQLSDLSATIRLLHALVSDAASLDLGRGINQPAPPP
ncbi:MAG: putative aminopeptidase [Pseudonocardiales bacterium]|jgi:putative aminopeptidase FrvX|nr:putative aminopeptidase [Pseudonocardiales bacterium]